MTEPTISVKLMVQHLPTQYFLHVITHTTKTDYRADGFESISNTLDEEGKLNITLFIDEAPDIPDFSLDNPIVHTLTLGSLPFGSEHGDIRVNVIDRLSGKIGDTIVSTADADEVVRPVDCI